MKKNNLKKKKNTKYKILSYIYIIISIAFLIALFMINVLPLKYYLIILFVLSIINIILWFFLACPKVKRSIKKISTIFSLFFIVLYLALMFIFFRTFSFLKTISSDDSMVINYSVLVLNNSQLDSLEQLRNKKMGFYKMNINANDSIKVPVDFDSYDSLDSMFNDLKNQKVDSILIEDSLKNMYFDDNIDYLKNTKVIYSFSIKEESNADTKSVNVSNKSFNVYLSGIDTYGEISSVSRSDVNIIISINPNTNKILLTSIPRDYYVKLYNKGDSKDKLTHAGIYGVDTSIKTIENLLGIDINYYVKVNFTSLIDIINIIGGISVDSDYEFTAWDGTYFNKGINYLNGEKALSFARERHSFSDGDRQRGKDQEKIIKAIISKVTSPTMITKYDLLLSKLSSKIQTNMTDKEIMSLVKKQINDGRSWEVETNNLDGINGFEYTYSLPSQKLYVMIPNDESISNSKRMIEQVSV